jgi:cyclohexa-1,5-dienecarbonyl-CoA hydratase
VPTAAAVRGRCQGGGMERACFCHWVVASPDAVFAQPEIQLAVLPPVASLILPFKVGQSSADTINLSGRDVGTPEAFDMGLVDQIADDPMTAVEAWAGEHLAKKSAAALRWACRASRWHFNKVLREELENVERLYLDELMETHDANEGLGAFLEKRKPEWQHR